MLYKHKKKYVCKKKKMKFVRKWMKLARLKLNQLKFFIRRTYRDMMQDAFVSTLEYIE